MQQKLRVLITSGGTSEPIDGVRYVTNFSSGRTGAAIAGYLSAAGISVHLLHGRAAVLPPPAEGCICESYTSCSDLQERLQRILFEDPSIGAVIHAAAVSDFSPDSIIFDDGSSRRASDTGKLSSDREFTVQFRRNPKVIDQLRSYAERSGREDAIIIVGFKLTHTADSVQRTAAVQALLSRGCCDLVVHNDLSEVTEAGHTASFYTADGSLSAVTHTKEEMSRRLLQLITGEDDGLMY
jgi:phosphopantothenoylcysteine synthetase/decarboxylase